MNLRKEKLDIFKAIFMAMKPRLQEILSEEQCMILHLYLLENKGLMEIAEIMHFTSYQIVKDELANAELRILSLG